MGSHQRRTPARHNLLHQAIVAGYSSSPGLERNILGFRGIGPIKETLMGMIDASENSNHGQWLRRLKELGREER
jgi:hypothetical protein